MAPEPPQDSHRTGTIAVLGKPNAGKSTLVNALVGSKVAIVSHKPQTTRTHLRGILTRPDGQLIFVDTPGTHRARSRLNREMMGAVEQALMGVDLFYLVIDSACEPDEGDEIALQLARNSGMPGLLVLNKVDSIKRSRLLPLIEDYRARGQFDEYIPVSALKRDNLDTLISETLKRLPPGPPLFPGDEFTDQPVRFMAAEIVREQVFHETHQEIPYNTAVLVEMFEQEENLARIHATILVERDGQKGIVLGARGSRIKRIGTRAREEIEKLLGCRVYLELFVKVRADWHERASVRGMIDWRYPV